MPRKAREKGRAGIYHIMQRGINQQQIFEDDEDNEKLLDVLGECKILSGFELFAYCLMGNHTHFLMKTHEEELDRIFKRIGARYVYWYNNKYQRCGHLYQDRFRSETIESDRQFLAVLRYIHQNPVKANLCGSVGKYKWSSYNEYLGESRIVDRDYALEMIGVDEFIKFNNSSNNDNFLDNRAKTYLLTDGAIKAMMRELCNCDTVEGFQRFNSKERDYYLKKLREKGASIRQISRLTGISKGIVQRR